jgi:YbbR domain-containing protein
MEKIFSNLGLKIAALFLALLLWFHATTDKTFVYDFDLPLTISNMPSDLILASPVPSKIEVKIGGKGKQLIKYFLSDKENVVIDVSQLKYREMDYIVRPEEIPLPKNLSLEVERVDSPKQIKILLDYFSEKKVPVRSQMEVITQSGYVQIDSLELKPDTVLLSGPRTLTRKIDQVYTERKVLGSLSSSNSGLLPLIVPEGFNLKLSPDKVEYSVKVEKLTQKEFTQISVELVNLPAKKRIKIEPKSINLSIQGVSQKVEGITSDKIKVSLDCNKLGDGKEGKIVPQVKLPKGVELVKIVPDSIKFTVE